MILDLKIESPKRNALDLVGRAAWYPYYAGFSTSFARSLLLSVDFDHDSCILDPWNGAGTTTATAVSLGLSAKGYDLNPAMAVIAKARTLNYRIKNSLSPIAVDIISKSGSRSRFKTEENQPSTDPLSTWFSSRTVQCIRRIENSIHDLLVDGTHCQGPGQTNVNQLSDLACFFYTALFRTVRTFLRPFLVSNPTWIKKPKSEDAKLILDQSDFAGVFEREVHLMIAAMNHDDSHGSFKHGRTQISVGSSMSLPDDDNSIHFVLSSPPYCTRIDYAVATMPELAILGFAADNEFIQLRRSLIGTATVPRTISDPSPEWGQTCNSLLQTIWSHRSKASRAYYYKNHLQYFKAIYESIGELQRVLIPGGYCILVIQDSYYKDIYNDLPQVFVEMSDSLGLHLKHRYDFCLGKSLAHINPGRKLYQKSKGTTESVLCFVKKERRGPNDPRSQE